MKLTPIQRDEIKRLFKTMPQRDIAKKFGVSAYTVQYWGSDRYRRKQKKIIKKSKNKTRTNSVIAAENHLAAQSVMPNLEAMQAKPMIALVGNVNDIQNALRGLFS